MKLSSVQQAVVDLLNDGWQLGSSMTMDGGCWMQKGGCGRGGESKSVSHSTVHSLLGKGVIVEDQSKFPLRTYKLAEGNS